MQQFLNDLLELLHNNVYIPFEQALNDSPLINEFVSFLNTILEALFGHTANITPSQLASTICIIMLSLVILLIVSGILEFIKIFKMKGFKIK